MTLPPWLAQLTGAGAFANNPANGFAPTFGDGLQGIGHSLMEHYRRNSAQPQEGGGGFNPMMGLLGSVVPPMGFLGQQMMGQPAPPEAAPPMTAPEEMGLPAPLAMKAKPRPPIDPQVQTLAQDVAGRMGGGQVAAPAGVPIGLLARLFGE